MDEFGGTGYWTSMMTNEDEGPGLDALSIPMTYESLENNEVSPELQENDPDMENAGGAPSEVDQVDSLTPSQGARRSRASRPNQKRTKNFDEDEDITLCKAWLKTGKDPIHGANQRLATFWGRVRAYFDEHTKSGIVRTESSLIHRWMTIQTQVSVFCSHYEKIVGRNQSGVTIQDMVNETYVVYKRLDRLHKPFTLTHCWSRLKDEDKWKSRMQELLDTQKAGRKRKQKTSSEAPTSFAGKEAGNTNGEATEPEAPGLEERKRPIGNKKAKEAARRGGSESAVEAFDKMWANKQAFELEKEKKKDERFNAASQLEKERLANEKEHLANEKLVAEAKMLKEEKEIMLVDKSKLDATALLYIEMKQKKIIERMSKEP